VLPSSVATHINKLSYKNNTSMTLFLIFTAFFMLFGLCFGSFANSIIYRLPLKIYRDYEHGCIEFLSEQGYDVKVKVEAKNKNEHISKQTNFDVDATRSCCPKCNHQIAWYDNIPLISFLLLKGKCRHCKTSISNIYFLSELFGVLWAGCVVFYPLLPLSFIENTAQLGISSWLTNLHFWALVSYFLAGWVLWLMFCIDAQKQLLPDGLTHSFIGLTLIIHLICYFDLEMQNDLIQSRLPSLQIGMLSAVFLVGLFQIMYHDDLF
jgi:leader peptidase (prepilin peptidase)/N-methyltransferase